MLRRGKMPYRSVFLSAVTLLVAALASRDAAVAHWQVVESASVPTLLAGAPALQVRGNEVVAMNPALFFKHAYAIGSNAKAALRVGPLNGIAMRQLAMIAARSDARASSKMAAMSERISRRDLAVQLMLIELESGRGDVAGALAHYDRALTTFPHAREALFAVLAQAIADPSIRSALNKYAGRSWSVEFLNKAIGLGSDPAAVIALQNHVRLHQPPLAMRNLQAQLIGQLVARGQYAALRDLVHQLPSSITQAIDQIAFSSVTSDARLSALGWTFTNDAAFETTLDGKVGLAIRVGSERSGTIAQRVTLLTPGRYQLAQTTDYFEGGPHAALQWVATCMGESSPVAIWKQSLPVTAGRTTYRAPIIVPPSCTAQSWQLTATAEQSQIASTARLSGLSLEKL